MVGVDCEAQNAFKTMLTLGSAMANLPACKTNLKRCSIEELGALLTAIREEGYTDAVLEIGPSGTVTQRKQTAIRNRGYKEQHTSLQNEGSDEEQAESLIEDHERLVVTSL